MSEKAYYALVVHRAVVDGEVTGRLDVSAYYFRASSEDEVRARIESRSPQRYQGGRDESVHWELSRILSIDEVEEPSSGDELTGCITSLDELRGLL